MPECESDYEYRVLTKNGEIRWWHDRGKLIKGDEDGADIWSRNNSGYYGKKECRTCPL